MKIAWETRKLGELLEVQSGYAFSSKDYSEVRTLCDANWQRSERPYLAR